MTQKKIKPCKNPECCTSTGICGSLTHGWGELDGNGYWEQQCPICTERELQKRKMYQRRPLAALWAKSICKSGLYMPGADEQAAAEELTDLWELVFFCQNWKQELPKQLQQTLTMYEGNQRAFAVQGSYIQVSYDHWLYRSIQMVAHVLHTAYAIPEEQANSKAKSLLERTRDVDAALHLAEILLGEESP